MKIAISGKGGSGKTLLSALLAQTFAHNGYNVIAVDADPDANLATALGFSSQTRITPLSEMTDLISERVTGERNDLGGYFKLNPHVSDIPDKFSISRNNIRLLVMGQVKKGGAGCYCPENSLLSALMAHLVLGRDEVVIMDMAAGIEHLNRGTARRVDLLLIVTDPSRAGVETARRINSLARDIGLSNIVVVGNKIRSQAEEDFITSSLAGYTFAGFIPYDQQIVNAEINKADLGQASQNVNKAVKSIYDGITGFTGSK